MYCLRCLQLFFSLLFGGLSFSVFFAFTYIVLDCFLRGAKTGKDFRLSLREAIFQWVCNILTFFQFSGAFGVA